MSPYNIKNILSTLLVIAGFYYYFDLNLLLYSLLTAYLLFNCVVILVHEGWAHYYITPQNRVIKFVLDYIAYIIFNTSKIKWRYLHIHHHKYWKTYEDWDQYGVDHTPWYLYLFFLYRNAPPNNIIKRMKTIEQFFEKEYNNLLPESKFLEKYHYEIVVATHALFAILFGLQMYFYFLFFQVWIFIRLFKLFTEIIPHRNKKTIEEEKDSTHLFLLCTNVAYHTSHHIYSDIIFFGKGWLKYLNIQYYFVRMFYKIHVKIR